MAEITGTSGDDLLQGTEANDRILGRAGNDTIFANGGEDEVLGEAGNDYLVGGVGNDTLSGGDGDDEVFGLEGNDVIRGEDGADKLRGHEGADDIEGGDGVDYIEGDGPVSDIYGDGNDQLSGGAGNDEIRGGGGDDTITGGGDADYIKGGAGSDHVDGGDGDDFLLGFGEEGYGVDVDADVLVGGGGNDRLYAGYGDAVDGGTGADTLFLSFYAGSTAGVTADLRALANNGTLTIGGAVISGIEYVGYLSLTQFDDVVIAGSVPGIEGIEVSGWDGNDDLTGSAGVDMIYGGNGNDVLRGGIGFNSAIYPSVDRINGEAGNDTIYIAGDGAFASGGTGNDTMYGGAAYDEMWGDDGADRLYGGGGNDGISGGVGDDYLDGGAGADTLLGGSGDDTYVVDNIADLTYENADAGSDTVLSSVSVSGLASGIENLTLVQSANLDGFGNELDNVLTGNGGANILDGRAGADVMRGGGGNDRYIVDNAGDVVTEAASAGTDTVQSGVSWALGANVENLALTGAGAINGTGNALANVLTGNDAANILDGGSGADTMRGGGGDDSYVVDNALDIVGETAGAGIDTVQTGLNYTLGAHLENLVLAGLGTINGSGNALANSLTGNAQANTLDGGAGADSMAGGLGNDTYIVDNAGDVVTEAAGAGTDLVRSALSHTLEANVENLILTGATSVNGTGNALVNSLTGNGGANVLDGSSGADTMNGGAGNDTYFVDDSLDRVSETSAANGTDTVQASVDYVLGANIENLILLGSAINGTGNALANSLTGNSAANTLNGGAGADVMRGYGGDDTYIVDNAGDIIGETPGNGTDTVQASVGYTLAPNVENLILMGTVAINGTGNAQNNAMTGNTGANVLKGGFGNDTLDGSDGNDSLFGDGGNDLMTGGIGTDRFTFQDSLGAGNADHITDFAPGSDKILLENSVFSTLPAGGLSAGAFVVGTAATDASDRIIYDSATGNLFYDSDGTGAGVAMLFATLDNVPATLAASDFLVI